MKEEIRPLYSRLQGLLGQAAEANQSYDHMRAQPLCDLANATIDELSTKSGSDYSLHKFNNELWGDYDDKCIYLVAYRGKLGGLIAELHGTYFFDEPAPFSGMPSMVITQNSAQSTSVQISILLEMQSKIDELLNKTEKPEEKNFLQKVKSELPSMKNVVELIALIIKTAQTFGVSLERIAELFS